MQRDTWSATTIARADGGLHAGIVAPSHYPWLVVESVGASALLEGAIYERSIESIREALAEFARSFPRDPIATRSAVEGWAARTTGDFVLAIVAGDGSRALVANDRLGRLPLYWARTGDGRAAVAREIKAVRAACGAGDADRSALAQMLLFSFPLGTNTLHAHIKRVPEGASVAIDATGAIDIHAYATWNFEALQRDDADDAAGLAARFLAATAAQASWAGERRTILGLSGGLDSRAVAAALVRSNVRCEAATFVSGRKKAEEETQTSAQIASALGIPWHELRLQPPSWEDECAMAMMRDGTSNVALAFIAGYFGSLAQQFGADAAHFTGDGGDRAMPDLRAEVPIRTRQAFLDYRLANALWAPAEAAALVGLPLERVVDDVRAHFASYPEKDPAMHNVRFMIADWAMCRLFCGEDRNRAFMWSMTPFYDQAFFEAAMRVPQTRKRHYRLYASFLRALDPRVLRVDKSNWGYAVDSPLVRWNAWRDALTTALHMRLRRPSHASGAARSGGRYGTAEHDPGFAALARRHRGSAFDPDRLRTVCDRGLDKLQYHMLATALAYADGVWESSAEERSSVPFGAG